MFEVKLKAGHPTGTYRRAGIVFLAGEVKKLNKLPDAVKKDPWLEVSEPKEPPKQEPPKQD